MKWDPDAFDALYRREHPAVLLFLARRTSLANAEDVAHEAFLTAWRKISAIPEDPIEARVWLCAVARNHLLNQTRGANRHQALVMRVAQELPESVAGPEDSVSTSVDFARAWNSLRPEYQEVIALTAWDAFSSAQAARVLGISAVAYRARLRRARRAFRVALEEPATNISSQLSEPVNVGRSDERRARTDFSHREGTSKNIAKPSPIANLEAQSCVPTI